ncbi:MAG: hypothetical protein Q9195_006956 [Heterodermia aff. obscurata]
MSTELSIGLDEDDQFGDGDIDDEEFLLAESTAIFQEKKRPNPFASTDAAHKKANLAQADPSIFLARRILKSIWGFPSFRLEQEAAITRLISGGSAVVIFPTGGGKSLVYQVPALAFDEYDEQCGLQPGRGLTLVVSPLIALMKDQVDALRKRNVAAAVIDSTQSGYVAPERLNNEGFIEMISSTRIRLVAIDEAHCISEWGHAFRPDYLKDKERALKEFLGRQSGSSIVYVQTHKQTEWVCRFLRKIEVNAFAYHAGLPSNIRTDVQEKFMKTQNIVIVATIAFGMGIDKPNIRNVVHYCLPKSLEGYSQQIGRAGRDGLESTCLTYLYAEDISIMEQWSRADVMSFAAVAGVVGEMFQAHQHAQVGDIIERDSDDEMEKYDFKMNALGLLNAQLELRFGLIRAITSHYANYKYVKLSLFEQSTAENSNVTKAIKQLSNPAKKWIQIDVVKAAQNAGVDRALIVRRLQEWSKSGAIELRPSGVINRFRVLKRLPQDAEEQKEIFAAMEAYFEKSEKDSMARIQDVIRLMTAQACISRGLAQHFGDEDSVVKEGCGHCSFCINKTPVLFDQSKRRSRKGRITAAKVIAVLAATAARDDPRFLARVAFGVWSPRVKSENLSNKKVFGSMEDCDFEVGSLIVCNGYSYAADMML